MAAAASPAKTNIFPDFHFGEAPDDFDIEAEVAALIEAVNGVLDICMVGSALEATVAFDEVEFEMTVGKDELWLAVVVTELSAVAEPARERSALSKARTTRAAETVKAEAPAVVVNVVSSLSHPVAVTGESGTPWHTTPLGTKPDGQQAAPVTEGDNSVVVAV